MKNLPFVLLIILLFSIRLSATNVSGPITSNTTWTFNNSPYVVTGNILVVEGITLTIEPGVIVCFNTSKAIQINGALVARGTAADSVKFTSNTTQTPGAWGNIYFTDTAIDAVLDNDGNYVSGSIFEYCRFEYGGKIEANKTDMLKLESSLPFIQHCSINNSLAGGINLLWSDSGQANAPLNYNSFSFCSYGISITGSLNVTIKYNQFKNNYRGLSVELSSGTLLVSNSEFLNNGSGLLATGQMKIENNVFAFNSQAISVSSVGGLISNNEFKENDMFDYGVLIYLDGKIDFTNNLCHNNHSNLLMLHVNDDCNVSSNIISDNTRDSLGFLMRFTGYSFGPKGSLHIDNNIITNNLMLNPLLLDLNTTNGYLTSNVITNNYMSGELLTASSYNSAITDSSTAIYMTDNIISQNTTTTDFLISLTQIAILHNNSIFDNQATYVLKNNNIPTFEPYLKVSNNYWGVETLEELSASIYDFFDDANLGITVYDSILLAPNPSNPVSPPSDVLRTNNGNNSVTLSWSNNPELDIKGYNVYWGNYTGFTFENMADAGLNNSFTIEGFSINDNISVTAYDNDYVAGKESMNWHNENMLNGHESPYSFDQHHHLGISETKQNAEFDIFPIPANEKITVQLKNQSNNYILNIVTLQGQIVKTLQISDLQTEFSLQDLPKGLYIVTLSDGKELAIKKIIKN